MDISTSLREAENSLRDFIAYILQKEIGSDWVQKCGVSTDRIGKWEERLETEKKKFQNSVTETRLIYYADFYDLKTILKKNWGGEFSAVFGKWKTIEVFLDELEKYRNPEAHRRELLPYQENLVMGITGELRNKIIRYRSMKEEKNSEDFYPRIERINDNIGNVWTIENGPSVNTKCKLHVGDKLIFQIAATDPYGENLKYGIDTGGIETLLWQDSNVIQIEVTKKNVARNFLVILLIKSNREFLAHAYYDDQAIFFYEVLPPI